MEIDWAIGLSMAAVATNAMLAGASVDQSVKQLPARRRMGAVAFSAYARAADLANGVALYAILGLGTAAVSVGAAAVALSDDPSSRRGGASVVLLVLTAGWLVVTSRAAPTYFSQRKVADDEVALEGILNRFTRLQTTRVVLQVTAGLASIWLLAATLNEA